MINNIVIACFKKDKPLLRTCVASIRYWYPDATIYLLKDHIHGDFSLKEFEIYWGCKIFPCKRKTFGWPWSKLSVVFHAEKEKFLFIDSDTVFLGNVLDKLSLTEADFIVTGINNETEDGYNVNTHYIDMKKLSLFDTSYRFPGFAFNGGQIVMTGGMLKPEDFSSVIDFEPRIINKYPEIFKHGDQGVLNYVFSKQHQAGKIKLAYEDFWIWPGMPQAKEIQLSEIQNKRGYSFVMHWAGIKPVDFRKYLKYEILQFYEDIFYDRIPFGRLKQKLRYYARLMIVKIKIAKYKIFKQNYV